MASADGSESAAKSGCKLDDIEKAYDLFSPRRDVALNRKISLRKFRKAKCSEELASGPAPPSTTKNACRKKCFAGLRSERARREALVVFNPRRTGEELRAHRFAERHSDGDGPGGSPW